MSVRKYAQYLKVLMGCLLMSTSCKVEAALQPSVNYCQQFFRFDIEILDKIITEKSRWTPLYEDLNNLLKASLNPEKYKKLMFAQRHKAIARNVKGQPFGDIVLNALNKKKLTTSKIIAFKQLIANVVIDNYRDFKDILLKYATKEELLAFIHYLRTLARQKYQAFSRYLLQQIRGKQEYAELCQELEDEADGCCTISEEITSLPPPIQREPQLYQEPLSPLPPLVSSWQELMAAYDEFLLY